MTEPQVRKTATGRTVHLRTIDHHPDGTAYQRLNKKVALGLTKYVGTMTTFWIFCVLALLSLPAVLSGFSVFHSVFPAVIIRASVIALVAWVAQTFIQLVLLPAIMVGQALQGLAADVRSEKQFDDIETIVDRLDEKTRGGIQVIMHELDVLHEQIEEVRAQAAVTVTPLDTVTASTDDPVEVVVAGNREVLAAIVTLEGKVDQLHRKVRRWL